MRTEILAYHRAQSTPWRAVCERLYAAIDAGLPDAEARIWHRHPVWFLDDNPIVGYSKLKAGIRLMFWSGASFDEAALKPGTGKFKDASVIYAAAEEVDEKSIRRWLEKARTIQWDYKNIVKRRGVLTRLK